jgi:Rhomboid family
MDFELWVQRTGSFPLSVLDSYNFTLHSRQCLSPCDQHVFLFVFGTALEARSGRNTLVICFFAGGAISLLLGIPLYPSNEIIIGSSIAISSVIGAVLVMMPFKPAPIFLFRAPLGLIAIIYLIFNAFFAYYGQTALGIAYPSHIIGFFVGTAIALVQRVYQQSKPVDSAKTIPSNPNRSNLLYQLAIALQSSWP